MLREAGGTVTGRRMSEGQTSDGRNARLGVDAVPEYSGCDKQRLRASAPLGRARSRGAGASWIGPEGPQVNRATITLHTRTAYHGPFCRRGPSDGITCGPTALSPCGRLILDLDEASQHTQPLTRLGESGSDTGCQWASGLGTQTLGRMVCSQWLDVRWCYMPYTDDRDAPPIQMGAPGQLWPT